MRRMLLIFVAVLATAAFATSAAFAVSPHFVNAEGNLNADGSLTVSFKEAGLGTNQNINYLLTADASATYVCVNKGGKNPSAQNKTTVAGPVSAEGTFSSGKNGNVTAALTVDPPPSDISCPGDRRCSSPWSRTRTSCLRIGRTTSARSRRLQLGLPAPERARRVLAQGNDSLGAYRPRPLGAHIRT
jgi:hypothetical protein